MDVSLGLFQTATYSDLNNMGFYLKRVCRFIIALAVSVLLTYPVDGFAKKLCIEHFARMAREIDREIFVASDIAKIEDILRNPQIPGAEAVDQAFAIYVDARLRDVGEEIAQPLRRLLKERLVVTEKGLMGSHYNPWTQTIRIIGPDRYVRNIEGLGIRAHEFEHALIDQTHRTIYGRPGIASTHQFGWNRIRFNDELAAMRAEWNMLQSIPVEIRQQTIAAIEADPKLRKSVKAFMIRALQNASLDRAAYIQAEHAAGRYSQSQLRNIDFMYKSMSGTLVATMLFMSSISASTEFCLWKTRDSSFDRTADWYQKVCVPNNFVQKEIAKQNK